jgi:hypothetical protein
MMVTRRKGFYRYREGQVIVDEADKLAEAVKITHAKPRTRFDDLRERRADLGPTAFDEHMWRTYETGDYGTVEIPVSKLQEIRIRLARSQRWLTHKHMQLLMDELGFEPYTFKTSLIVTDLDGNRLAEGPVKGNLTSSAIEALDPDTKVVLWFQMHLPQNLGRRARPEAYS